MKNSSIFLNWYTRIYLPLFFVFFLEQTLNSTDRTLIRCDDRRAHRYIPLQILAVARVAPRPVIKGCDFFSVNCTLGLSTHMEVIRPKVQSHLRFAWSILNMGLFPNFSFCIPPLDQYLSWEAYLYHMSMWTGNNFNQVCLRVCLCIFSSCNF